MLFTWPCRITSTAALPPIRGKMPLAPCFPNSMSSIGWLPPDTPTSPATSFIAKLWRCHCRNACPCAAEKVRFGNFHGYGLKKPKTILTALLSGYALAATPCTFHVVHACTLATMKARPSPLGFKLYGLKPALPIIHSHGWQRCRLSYHETISPCAG